MDAKHRRKINELLKTASGNILENAERLYKSGGIDVESYSNDEYALAKVLLCAAMQNEVHRWRPLHGDHRHDLNNLMNF